MTDYQTVTEFLRDFHATPGQAITDEVRRYAAEYAQLCAGANERLRRCSVFLQQGLRSEALHLAEEPPKLLELVAALDIPDSKGWSEFCQGNDLPVPPPLQIDRAARLTDAYEQEQPLKELLRRHRRLALGRAAVKLRLDTMRQIAAADPDSGFWERDIRIFETARTRELKLAFATAMERKDSAAMETLAAEVLKTHWLEPVSADLLSAAQGTDDRVRLLGADVKLRKVLASLREAFAARDFPQCAALLKQIPQIVSESKLPGVSSETAAELKPVMAWVHEEEKLQARRQESQSMQHRLIEAMDSDAPESALEGCYQSLRRLEQALPDDLEQRYQTAMGRRHRAAQRKHWLRLSAVAAALLLVLAGGYLAVRLHGAQIWADRINQANASRDLAGARQLIQQQEKLAPQFSTWPNVVAAKQETTRLEKQFTADSQQLAQLMASLQSAESAAEAAGASPQATPDSLLLAARAADDVVAQAAALSSLDWVDTDHKLDRPGALQQLASQAQLLRQQANNKAAAQADDIAGKIDQLSVGSSPQSAREAMQTLDGLDASVKSLAALAGLDKTTADAIAALPARLAAKRQALFAQLSLSQQLAAMPEQAKSAEQWRKALEAFAAKFPEAPQTPDFKEAASSIDGSAAIEALAAIVQGWSGQLAVGSENAAKDRLEKLKAYSAAYPRSPLRGAVDDYSGYLQQAASALDVKGTWQQAFHELLASPLISDLSYVTASDGTRYYVMGDIKLRNEQVGDQVWTSFEAIDPANVTKRKTINLRPPLKLTSDKPQFAPHSKFAQTLSAQINQVGAADWETYGIGLIDQLAHDTEMDPVVRAILLQQALTTTAQVDGLGDLYGPAIRGLARWDVESLVWYDPDHPVPDATINGLKQIIVDLPKSQAAEKALQDGRAKLFSQIDWTYLATGALMRDDAGAWMVCPCGTAQGATVWAAGPRPADDSKPAPLLRVAGLVDGKYAVDETAAKSLPQGTMVFFRK